MEKEIWEGWTVKGLNPYSNGLPSRGNEYHIGVYEKGS